jgi:hypothetical protein
MPESLFWWKGLSIRQQLFIVAKFQSLAEKSTEESFAQFAYDNREHLRKLDGWPESEMRKI